MPHECAHEQEKVIHVVTLSEQPLQRLSHNVGHVEISQKQNVRLLI